MKPSRPFTDYKQGRHEHAGLPPLGFVCGMPRSGTTLLSRLVDTHSRITVTPESHYFSRDWNMAMRRRRYGMLIGRRPEASGFRRGFEAVVAPYAQGGEQWLIEKTPQHLEYLPVIRTLFPTAPVVVIVRDPRAVCASLDAVEWDQMSLTANAMRWRFYSRRTARELERSPDYTFVLHYESLLASPETVMRSLFDWLGVDREPVTESFATRESAVVDARAEPWKARADGPLDPSRLDQWRGTLRADEIARVERIARCEMQRWGYEPVSATGDRHGWLSTDPACWRYAVQLRLRHGRTRAYAACMM